MLKGSLSPKAAATVKAGSMSPPSTDASIEMDYVFIVDTSTKKKEQWQKYSNWDQATMHVAYCAGLTEVPLGPRTIRFDRMVQISAWGNERNIQRVPLSEADKYETLAAE